MFTLVYKQIEFVENNVIEKEIEMNTLNQSVKMGLLAAMISTATAIYAAESTPVSLDRNIYVQSLPLVFSDGSMVQATGVGIYDTTAIEFTDAALNHINTVALDSQARELLWIKAAMNGAVWVLDEENHLFAYDPASETVNKLSLTANLTGSSSSDVDDNGAIVNTDNELVIYNRVLAALVAYDVNFNVQQQLSYASCEAGFGYFACLDSDGNLSYVDADTFNVSVDQPVLDLISEYVVSHENTDNAEEGSDRLMIENQQGETLFDLVTAKPIKAYALSKSHVAFVVEGGKGSSNQDVLYLYDWQQNLIQENIMGYYSALRSLAFHPSGYLMVNRTSTWTSLFYPVDDLVYENLSTGHMYYYDTGYYDYELLMSNDYSFDYLNSGNDDVVRAHQISTTNFDGNGDQDPSTEPGDEGSDPEDNLPDENEIVQSSGSGGGSTGWIALMGGLFAIVIRKRRIFK